MCSLDSNLYNKVNILCHRLSILEKTSGSGSGFTSTDYAFASRNEAFGGLPFPVGLFTFTPTTFDGQNITLQADNATFQVANAGVYQVILAGSVRANGRDDTTQTFVYQLTTTPANTTAVHNLHAQSIGDTMALTAKMRINELVELPAGGTIAVNILLNTNATTVPGSFDISTVPITISIIRIA